MPSDFFYWKPCEFFSRFHFGKAHNGSVIAPFSEQILKCLLQFFLAKLDVSRHIQPFLLNML